MTKFWFTVSFKVEVKIKFKIKTQYTVTDIDLSPKLIILMGMIHLCCSKWPLEHRLQCLILHGNLLYHKELPPK